MFRRVNEKEIAEKWDNVFQPAIHLSLNSSAGAIQTIGYHENAIKNIFNKLTNPFNATMQLWVAESDDIDYVVLTQGQVCEFTGRKSLLIFASTRLRDIDSQTKLQGFQEAVKVITEFAITNDCEGISGYTDLAYVKDKVVEAWPEPSTTRHFFYLPIK